MPISKMRESLMYTTPLSTPEAPAPAASISGLQMGFLPVMRVHLFSASK